MELSSTSNLDIKKNKFIIMYIQNDSDIVSVMTQVSRDSSSFMLKNVENPSNDKVVKLRELLGNTIFYKDISTHINKLVNNKNINVTKLIDSINKHIDDLNKHGKSENALNNIYIRFISWLYFECKPILNSNKTVLYYYGLLNEYLVRFFEILTCIDIYVIALTKTELDSEVLNDLGIPYTTKKFAPIEDKPSQVQSKSGVVLNDRPVKVPVSKYKIGTNLWLEGDNLEEIFVDYNNRSGDNCTKSVLIQYNGVEDKTSYTTKLFNLYDLHKDNTIVVENDFSQPTPNDINELRSKYRSDDLNRYIMGMCTSLSLNSETYGILVNEYINTISSLDSKLREKNLLYSFFIIKGLVHKRSILDRSYLFFLQTSKISKVQSIVFYLLSCIMYDVVIFNPSNIESDETIKMVYVMNNADTLSIKKFPKTAQDLVIETTAYSAENEIKGKLYDGSIGIYDNNQFSKARVAYLKPMNEEIDILWDKEVSYRQGFNTVDNIVTIPTIFARIDGVGNGINSFIQRLYKLLENKDHVFCNRGNPIFADDENKKQSRINLSGGGNLFGGLSDMHSLDFINSAEVFRNKKIDYNLMKNHVSYKYGYLSDEIQNHLIEKLQELCDSGIIKGVYTSGVENDVLTTFVNISKYDKLMRMIQNFDFTRLNPKFVYVWMDKVRIPKFDIILMHYLNFVGFDVLVFIPTGYNVMDFFLDKKIYTEYRDGNGVEPFNIDYNSSKLSFFDKLFMKGR